MRLVLTRGSLPRFVLSFLISITWFYVFLNTRLFETVFFRPYLHLTSEVVGATLRSLGQDAVVNGSVISTGEYALGIDRGCDASEPIALFAAFVLAFPASATAKLRGLVLGASVLVFVNFIRVLSLFIVGVHHPALFYFMHTDVWQTAFILLVIVLWSLWLAWIVPNATARRVASG